MRQLSPEALEVLKRICTAYAGQPFEASKGARLRPATLCRAEQQLALQELRQAGMLEVRQTRWGEKLYQIPAERLPLLERVLFPYTPQDREAGVVNLTMEPGAGLAGDLFRALRFTAGEGLPLTAKGSIHKKNISRLEAVLSFGANHLQGLPLDFPSPELYAPAAAVAVDLMLCLGLIRAEKAGYTLEAAALASWLELAEAEMADILYGVVMNRYGPSEPADQHFRYLISAPEFMPGQWAELPELLDWMEAAGLTGGDGRVQLEASSLAWLRCLAGFGWCELGTRESGTLCFRWTAAKPQLADERRHRFDPAPAAPAVSAAPAAPAAPSYMFLVQPDFEILVPPEVSYAVRWTLAGCAELLSSDGLWSFRLTRDMLESAAEQGISPEETLAWLESQAQGGLPETVVLSMEQWGRNIGRTSLTDAGLLVCRTEEDGAAIAAHPRLQGCLTRLGPLHFSVLPQGRAQVRRELRAAGLPPSRLRDGQDEAAGSRLSRSGAAAPPAAYVLPAAAPERGLLRSSFPLHGLPAAEEEALLPGEEYVPPMWSRDWRHYHSSTAQKVMEQALQWGIKVRLSLKGEICDFIPEQMNGHPWRVTGQLLYPDERAGEPIGLAAGEWEEMKLIIPKLRRNSSSA